MIQRFLDFRRLNTNSEVHKAIHALSIQELAKRPTRTEIINCLLQSKAHEETSYLEIGVRNPDDNFNKINASKKYSVDPGLEFKTNPVDFKMTSDDFFAGLNAGNVLDVHTRFDVIFIDGLHEARQVEKDISNALEFLNKDGFIVVHDCNPPSEYHAREDYQYKESPAEMYWNGTTWKAFYKYRLRKDLFMCCIDSDWGVGIITRNFKQNGLIGDINPYFEYRIFSEHRAQCLNLVSFEEFQSLLVGEKRIV